MPPFPRPTTISTSMSAPKTTRRLASMRNRERCRGRKMWPRSDLRHLWLAAFGAPLAVIAIMAGTAAHAQKAPDSEGPDISGVWWANIYSPKIALIGGGELPFTPAGKAAYEKNRAGLKNGSVEDPARTLCTPDGI